MSSQTQGKKDKKDHTDPDVDDIFTPETDNIAGAMANSDTKIQPDNNSIIYIAINNLKSEFLSQYKEVLSALKDVREDLSSFTERLTEAKSCIGQAEYAINDIQGRVSKLEMTTTDLAAALDLAECRSRRSNIRILGLPNGVERKKSDFISGKLATSDPGCGLFTGGGYHRTGAQTTHRLLSCKLIKTKDDVTEIS